MTKVDEHDMWVFLSHSNKDYEKVRKVRDILENHNRKPIMFFLKCLDDDSEIWELVKREIDARSRFILCKSENTEDPLGWVQKEFSYIQSQHKPFEIVDMNSMDFENNIKRLVKRSNVYICTNYFRMQKSTFITTFTEVLKNKLIKESFLITDYDELNSTEYLLPGVCTQDDHEILHHSTLTAILNSGYVIYLWSQSLCAEAKREVENIFAINVDCKYILSFILEENIDILTLNFLQQIHKSFNVRIENISNLKNVELQCNYITSSLRMIDLERNNCK